MSAHVACAQRYHPLAAALGGTSELKETWNDNSAAIFEATHDGRHEGILPKKYHFENFNLLSSKDSYNHG